MSPGRRWTLVALAVAACAASFFVGGVAAQAEDPQAQRRVLRVMTYNIKHGQTNPWEPRRPYIARAPHR